MPNELRCEYIERAKGLRIAIVFNTTVHAGNLEEVPALAHFFLSVSDVVGMASFQLQAETRWSPPRPSALQWPGIKLPMSGWPTPDGKHLLDADIEQALPEDALTDHPRRPEDDDLQRRPSAHRRARAP